MNFKEAYLNANTAEKNVNSASKVLNKKCLKLSSKLKYNKSREHKIVSKLTIKDSSKKLDEHRASIHEQLLHPMARSSLRTDLAYKTSLKPKIEDLNENIDPEDINE